MNPPNALVPHPQPLGLFGVPAGLLLIPGGEQTRCAREELAAGRRPRTWPEELSGHRLVHEGLDGLEAADAFTGSDAVAGYNRWLLNPAGADRGAVRAALPAAVAPLVDVAAHTLGLAPPPDPQTLDPQVAPEVRALVLAAAATAQLQDGDTDRAVATMLRGADEAGPALPVLGAVLRGNAGVLLQEKGELDRARTELGAAVAGLAGADVGEVSAELLLRLGSVAQEQAAAGGDGRALLQEAIQHYYQGLQIAGEQSLPFLWASLTMNLATAHLAVPMSTASDQLRLGVAAQGLRACRRVFTAGDYPAQWSTATLNLANALVYTPSTHQGDNLVEAVELYEEVLASGVRDDDPLGRARLLANQGNVLAHLGAFEAARGKLVEARFLFEAHLDHDGATTVRGLLDELARTERQAAPDGAAGADETTDEAAAEAAALARAAEQMSRIPQHDGAFSSGMGVRVVPATSLDAAPPPKPKVTVVDPATRPGGTR